MEMSKEENKKEAILISVQCFFMRVIIKNFGDVLFKREGDLITVCKHIAEKDAYKEFIYFRPEIIKDGAEFKVIAETGFHRSIPEETRKIIREETMLLINSYLYADKNIDIKNIQVEF